MKKLLVAAMATGLIVGSMQAEKADGGPKECIIQGKVVKVLWAAQVLSNWGHQFLTWGTGFGFQKGDFAERRRRALIAMKRLIDPYHKCVEERLLGYGHGKIKNYEQMILESGRMWGYFLLQAAKYIERKIAAESPKVLAEAARTKGASLTEEEKKQALLEGISTQLGDIVLVPPGARIMVPTQEGVGRTRGTVTWETIQ